MIAKTSDSSGNIVALKLSGEVIGADYQKLVPELVAVAGKEKTINILFDMTELVGFTFAAGLDDIAMAMKLQEAISKFAIVGGRKWEKELAKLYEFFIGTEVKYFDDSEKALKWLQE